jgi:tetratricopeptide (TPR) repeat protein
MNTAVMDDPPTLLRPELASLPSGARMPDSPETAIGPRTRVPERLGHYRILGRLGKGGMGEVFRALVESLERVVALKVLDPELQKDDELKRQFLAEARLLAGISHPHVVPLHEYGEAEGIVHFTMRLIEGGTLRSLLNEGPINPRMIARILSQVARGVQALHDLGIVHRDLKPSNILLEQNHHPLIADLGLSLTRAAAVEKSRRLRFCGTPAYMAPELVRRDPTARGEPGDIYSQGAILYECLTGRAPFGDRINEKQFARIIVQEPVAPHHLNPGVPTDLETITLKCLSKSPARRYESAGELADDLERFLRNEPIRARRAGWGQRFRKWCVRNPPLATLTLSFIAMLALSSALLANLYFETRAAWFSARRQHELAVLTADRLLATVTDGTAVGGDPGLVKREMLQHALKLLEGVENGPDRMRPEVRRLTASTHVRVGELQFELGRTDQAEASFRRAIKELEEGPDASFGRTKDDFLVLGEALGALGWLLVHRGDRAAARLELGRSLETLERLEPADDDSAAHRMIGLAHARLAGLATDSGDRPAAEAAFRLSADHRRRALDAAPNSPAVRHELARSLKNHALALARLGRREEAEPMYRRAIEMLEQLAEEHPGSVQVLADLARVWRSSAFVLQEDGRLADRLESRLLETIAVERRLLMLDPGSAANRLDLSYSLHSLASRQLLDGRVDSAGGLVREALNLYEPIYAAEPDMPRHRSGMARLLRLLALTESRRNELTTARSHLDRALNLVGDLSVETLAEWERQVIVDCLAERSVIEFRQGEVALAEADLKRLAECACAHMAMTPPLIRIEALARGGRLREARNEWLAVDPAITELPINRWRSARILSLLAEGSGDDPNLAMESLKRLQAELENPNVDLPAIIAEVRNGPEWRSVRALPDCLPLLAAVEHRTRVELERRAPPNDSR